MRPTSRSAWVAKTKKWAREVPSRAPTPRACHPAARQRGHLSAQLDGHNHS